MKKIIFMALLVGGCADGCISPVHKTTIDACKKACEPGFVKSVTETKCECHFPPGSVP